MRINGETFDFILKQIAQLIHKEPIYMVPNPIEDQSQLGLTIYRFTLGCSFKVIVGMFKVSQSLAAETFILLNANVMLLSNELVCLSRTEIDWANECEGSQKTISSVLGHGTGFMSALPTV